MGVIAQVAQSANINGVRVWRAPDHTRIVLDLDGPVQHKLSQVADPERVILDLTNTKLNTGVKDLPLADTPVNLIRSSAQNTNDLRIVFDLKTRVSPNSFFLKANAGIHDRLVLDLYDIAAPQTQFSTDPIKVPVGSPQPITSLPVVEPEPVPAAIIQEASGSRAIVIAVDAGHGGEDPGAMGPNRVREKEITLAIAKELVAEINSREAYSGKLTRTGDYFIPLKKRRDIARSMKADLFVSIHADAFARTSARGASVFALSRNGATSETARFLAQRENESDLIGGVGGISLDDKDEVLAGVLVDLSMTATLNSSLQVGNHVLKSLGGFAYLHKRHVEQAGFMVLKSPDVPSILVETGFISNPEESRKLSTPVYRKQMAQSVFKGIAQYFMQHPPAGTLLASQLASGQLKGVEREHTVAMGDTLSAIAIRYGVSVSQLMRHNRMSNSTVKVGQTLKIPSG